ncbi:hypothetical protein HK100_006873 [Physocladia obscura]|uniref:hydroxymethylbilane synthase n=1 Tax=Physocladia obscura TaxID=109957 RepID=A0AAD5T626_9FUNG|nr:hypothetical protein HK100_006873 [Physocladia obscura]
MTLGAILKREDPRDAVILKKDLHDRHFSLESLPKGSVIGTGSVRRVAQLRRRFPHLVFQDVRGNIDTRLAKLDDASSPYCALILAHAGLTRINRADRVSQTLSDDSILYAVGQGAICIESRADDRDVAAVVSTLEHLDTALRCIAERAFMRGLEGGCSVPLGVWSELAVIGGSKARLLLKGNVCSVDGAKEVRGDIVGEIDLRDADKAKSVAEQMGHDLSLKLVELGAQNILKEIRA